MPTLSETTPSRADMMVTASGAHRGADFQPAMFTIQGAQDFSGLARSRLYELMSAGTIEARKCGRRTLLVGDSLRQYLANLPRADIRMGKKAA
jgi:hypothetical protein